MIKHIYENLFLNLFLFLLFFSGATAGFSPFSNCVRWPRDLTFPIFFETLDMKPTALSLAILCPLFWTPKWSDPSSSLWRLMRIAVLLFCCKYFYIYKNKCFR